MKMMETQKAIHEFNSGMFERNMPEEWIRSFERMNVVASSEVCNCFEKAIKLGYKYASNAMQTWVYEHQDMFPNGENPKWVIGFGGVDCFGNVTYNIYMRMHKRPRIEYRANLFHWRPELSVQLRE